MGGVERRGRRRGAARAWKHSQYFLRQPDFLQWQPLLCRPTESVFAAPGAEWLIFGRNAEGLRSSVCSMARLRISSFSGLLWQAWQLQPKQYWPEAKHSQYSFRQREFLQLQDLRSLPSFSCPRPRGADGVLPLFGSQDGRVTREDSPPSSAGTSAARPAGAMRRDKSRAVKDCVRAPASLVRAVEFAPRACRGEGKRGAATREKHHKRAADLGEQLGRCAKIFFV